jgi:hypothetical protein
MKLYTLEEARALLPEVIPTVTRLRDAYVELRARRATFAAETRGASGDGQLLANPWEKGDETRLERMGEQLKQSAEALERWGIEVKDPERGLIDFYSEREGRTVYLCFLLGEHDIEYWHELAGGFAGRQAL